MVNGEQAYAQQLALVFTAVEVRTDPVVPNASVTAIALHIPTTAQDKRTGFDGTTDEFWLATGAPYAVIVDSPGMVGDAVLDISDVFRDGFKHYFLVVRMRSKADIEAVKARLVLTASSAWAANAVTQLNNGISDILRSVSFGAVKLVRFEVQGNDVVLDLQELVRSPGAIAGIIVAILALSILAVIVIISIRFLAEYLPKPFVPATNPNTGKPCLPGECGCPEGFVMNKDGQCVPIGNPLLDIKNIIIIAGVAAAGLAGIALVREFGKRRR